MKGFLDEVNRSRALRAANGPELFRAVDLGSLV